MPSMRRLLLVFLTLALLASRAFADDGWMTERGYTPSEGALRCDTADTPVVLEKEYLELRDLGLGSTRAVYLFHNTADSAVAVDCSFPLAFDFLARRAETAAASWSFTDVVTGPGAEGQPGALRDTGFVHDVLNALGVPATGASFRDDQYPRGAGTVDAGQLRTLFGFRLLQDGKEAAVTACQADFGERPGSVRVGFRLRLSFAPGQRSTVVVTYAMPTRSQAWSNPEEPAAPVRSTWTWKYVLAAASSWKDPVGAVVLSVPVGLEQELTAPWTLVGTQKGQVFYSASAWKPDPADNLTLTWTRADADYVKFWRDDARSVDPADLPPADSPATLIGASSYLAERADVFTAYGIWHNAPFDPARLFDGLVETAWVVRTPRGGIGEWVKFSLDAAVCRLEIANGWQRSMVNFPDKSTWSYFAQNNRVKSLDIVRDDGTAAARLSLADTREVQRFDLSLPPGIYRAVITGIYPGSRWNDTCLGELSFVRGTATGFADLNRDGFFGPLLK
jgi:hypothetical protein